MPRSQEVMIFLHVNTRATCYIRTERYTQARSANDEQFTFSTDTHTHTRTIRNKGSRVGNTHTTKRRARTAHVYVHTL